MLEQHEQSVSITACHIFGSTPGIFYCICSPQLIHPKKEGNPYTLRFSLELRKTEDESQILTIPGFRVFNGTVLSPSRSMTYGKGGLFPTVVLHSPALIGALQNAVLLWEKEFPEVLFPGRVAKQSGQPPVVLKMVDNPVTL